MLILPYLLKVSLLLAALTLGYRWLIQFETFSHLNRALLWLNVLAAWSLPLIPLATWGPVEVQQEFHHTLPQLVAAVPSVVPVPTFVTSSEQVGSPGTPGNSMWGLPDWLLLIYFVGVGFMFVRFLYQLSGLLRALYKHPAERLENGVRLVRDEGTPSPYSFFHWVVCNPEKHTPTELQHILLHESEHARQGHSVDLFLAEIQRILLWFNPFAWVHQRLVQGNLEYLADRAVLESGFQRKDYQISLLKTALRTNEPPLTNSFAQSLLKKRIKMMNRKPSPRWVAAKYACLLTTLYLSSAFVAPYKSKIVAVVPMALQPMVQALVTEPEPTQVVVPAVEVPYPDSLQEVTGPIPQETKAPLPDTTPALKSKWVQMKGDTLFWTIPATATWDEISLIKEDFSKFGARMRINELKYDPIQQFITRIAVYTNSSSGSSGTGGDSSDDDYSPVKGYSGYVFWGGGIGMGQRPPEPLLTQYNQSYQDALALQQANKSEYVEDKLMKEFQQKDIYMARRSLSKASFEDTNMSEKLENLGLGKSIDNKLHVTSKHLGATFYLDGQPSTMQEVNTVPINKIRIVSIGEDRNDKKYILVFTN